MAILSVLKAKTSFQRRGMDEQIESALVQVTGKDGGRAGLSSLSLA